MTQYASIFCINFFSLSLNTVFYKGSSKYIFNIDLVSGAKFKYTKE